MAPFDIADVGAVAVLVAPLVYASLCGIEKTLRAVALATSERPVGCVGFFGVFDESLSAANPSRTTKLLAVPSKGRLEMAAQLGLRHKSEPTIVASKGLVVEVSCLVLVSVSSAHKPLGATLHRAHKAFLSSVCVRK